MKLKILTCECFIAHMRGTDVRFEVNNSFDSCEFCNVLHKLVAVKCRLQRLNMNGSLANYFTINLRMCRYVVKDKICWLVIVWK